MTRSSSVRRRRRFVQLQIGLGHEHIRLDQRRIERHGFGGGALGLPEQTSLVVLSGTLKFELGANPTPPVMGSLPRFGGRHGLAS